MYNNFSDLFLAWTLWTVITLLLGAQEVGQFLELSCYLEDPRFNARSDPAPLVKVTHGDHCDVGLRVRVDTVLLCAVRVQLLSSHRNERTLKVFSL